MPAMYLAGVAELLLQRGGGGGCRNLPKRVPVLAKPQEGISIRNFSRAVKIRPVAFDSICSCPLAGDYTDAMPLVTRFLAVSLISSSET